MNPAMLKIASLVLQCNASRHGTPLESGGNGAGFTPLLQRSMNSVHKGPFARSEGAAQPGLRSSNGYHFYLESLRKSLLATGKSLGQISLKGGDISILERFLCQCGFSQEKAKSLLSELVKGNPRGELSLSQFFRKVKELDQDKEKMCLPVTVEASAIPYIESALRACGLNPKQLDQAFSDARGEAGGLNLQRLVGELKGLSAKIGAQGETLSNKLNLDQFVKALEGLIARASVNKGGTLGDQIKSDQSVSAMKNPHQGTGGQIPMKDLMFGEETVMQKVHNGNQVPTDIRDTIEQIVERAVMTEEKEGPLSSALSLSRLKLTGLHGREKIAAQGKAGENQGLLSSVKSQGQTNANNGEQKVGSPFPGGKDGLTSGLDAGKGAENRAEQEQYSVTSKTKVTDMPHPVSSSEFSETTTTVKQNQRPVAMNFLPTYLVDQVAKQLARSALRGERVITLQLKPPELGAVKVEMDIKGNMLKVWMVAENSSVRELLLSNVHELREALVDQGVKLERLDVQINYDSNQSLAHSKEGFGEGQKWIRDADGLVLPAPEGGEDSLTGPGTSALSHHVLDLII
jgi:hypothetical protein